MFLPSRISPLSQPLKYAFLKTRPIYPEWLNSYLRAVLLYLKKHSSWRLSKLYKIIFPLFFFRTEATWCSSQFDSRVTSVYPVYVCSTRWLPEWWSESKVVANINNKQHQKSIKGQFMFNKILIMNMNDDRVCTEVFFLP